MHGLAHATHEVVRVLAQALAADGPGVEADERGAAACEAALDFDVRGHDGVVQQAAGAADGDLAGAAIAAQALRRLVVRSAPVVLVVVPQQADVSGLAPLRAPRVLDQPVLVAGFVLAVALGENGVAEDRILCTIVEDTRLVVEPIIAVHGHDHRALLHQRLHQWLRPVAGQLIPASDADAGRRLPEAGALGARLCPARVRQVALQRNAVIAHPSIGELAGCTLAAAGAPAVLRVRHAVHKRLRRDPRHFGAGPAGTEELGLEGLGGGDGPATAAIALVPDGGSTVDVHAPGGARHVLVCRGVHAGHAAQGAAEEGHGTLPGTSVRLVAVQGLALIDRPIHEGVHACLPEAALLGDPGVGGGDLRQGGLEELGAAVELLGTLFVVPVEFAHELFEGVAVEFRARSRLPQGHRIAAQECRGGDGPCHRSVHGSWHRKLGLARCFVGAKLS
mmetsp:Transcript_89777/g.234150  ORF Transcript_89777/g.234150 Transcript_89777/m.234150 type:complete len:449 (-) Transcript_89777:10-1356(-)